MAGVKVKTPVILKVVCYLGMFGAFLSFISTFSPALKKVNPWFPLILGLIIALRFISFVGVQYMKRWGVELFIVTYFAVLTFAVIFSKHYSINFLALAFNTWFLINMLFFYKRMDRNL